MVIEIKVADRDDTPPYFLNQDSWDFEIDEFDSLIGNDFTPYSISPKIVVADLDIDQHFKFELIENSNGPSGLINITQTDNQVLLQVVKPIDRENELIGEYLTYTLKVFDNANNSNQTEIAIKVNDVNDNEPVFEDSDYSTKVPELTPDGTSLNISVHATDKDATSLFNTVYYELPSSDDPFRIDRTSGELFVYLPDGQELDYESDSKTYTVLVVAKDGHKGQASKISNDLNEKLSGHFIDDS